MWKSLTNRFRNRLAETQKNYVIDNFDDVVRSQTEEFWRITIANEIYKSCPSVRRGKYPCEECYEMYEFVMHGKQTSHDS